MVGLNDIYVIPGIPIPLARPRFGGKYVWDSQSQLKHQVGVYILHSRPCDYQLISGPIELYITFFFKRSKSNKRTHHSIKPDLSNLIKFYEDVCTGILYDDDKQIVKIIAEKKYGDHPRTVLYVKEIDHEAQGTTEINPT